MACYDEPSNKCVLFPINCYSGRQKLVHDRGGESGLHRRSPGLTPELQSAVRADEVVMTTQQLEMFSSFSSERAWESVRRDR